MTIDNNHTQTGDQKIDGLTPELFSQWIKLPFVDSIDKAPGIKKKLKQTDYKANGKIPVIDQGQAFIAGYTDKEDDKYEVDLPIIIFGDHTKCVKYLDFEFAVGADGTKIVIPKNIFNKKYFFHYLKSLRWQDDYYGRHFKYLKQIIVPLPPLSEQERIVAKLDTIMPRIESVKDRLEKIPLIIKRFRQSVLTAAVTGNLTEEWREKHPDVECADNLLERIKEFKINNAKSKRELNSIKKNDKEGFERLKNIETPFSIPDKWRYCEINSIGNVYNGSTPSRKVPEYWNGDINWISSGEVANLRIESTREQITHEGFKNSSVKLFPKGTVLIAMIGEGKTRGQTAILDIESTCNQNIAAIIINHGLVLPEYLYNWLFMQYEHNRNFGSGSGPKALNCQRVREIDFVLPPLEEQKQIVKEVDKLFTLADKVEIHYQQAKERVDKLSQSILAKAFRGELVPQDPNDEPASVLLERIIEEKTKMEKQLKSSKTASRKKREIKK